MSTTQFNPMDTRLGDFSAAAQYAAAEVKDVDSPYKEMVNRFLGMKLPDGFCPDCYVSFDREKAIMKNVWPVGTNLFTADQALEMFKHCVQLPADHTAYITAAVERINATLYVEGETAEGFRQRIADRVADIAKPTFVISMLTGPRSPVALEDGDLGKLDGGDAS